MNKKNGHSPGITILRECLRLNLKLLNVTNVTIKLNKAVANKIM